MIILNILAGIIGALCACYLMAIIGCMVSKWTQSNGTSPIWNLIAGLILTIGTMTLLAVAACVVKVVW